MKDLVPSDYRLCSNLKEHLRGRRFSSDNDVKCAVNDLKESFVRKALEMLEHRTNVLILMETKLKNKSEIFSNLL